MGVIRSKITLAHTSALPRDATVHTLHWITDSGGLTGAEQTVLDTAIGRFFNFDHGAANSKVAYWLSQTIDRGADKASIEYFDLDDPAPRVPIAETTFTLAAVGSTNDLPAEVAACLSFKAAPASGVNPGRLRGRIFVGPLSYIAVDVAGGQMASTFVAALAAQGNGLLDETTGSVAEWAVYSPTTHLEEGGSSLGAAYLVTEGWVDNEFDTQRRRGLRATTRTTFT